MAKETLERWLAGYLKAWLSNDPADIAALFIEDAEYYTAPFRQPWAGREAIVAGWIGRDDQPGNWDFEHEWLAVEGDTGVLRGLTSYKEPQAIYSNIWLIRLNADGRCREFREWWVKRS